MGMKFYQQMVMFQLICQNYIYFEEDGTCRKFVFPNEKPTKDWEEYEITCTN